MRNVVVEQKIVNILWSNWIVQAELCENLCQNVGDLKTRQVTFMTSVVLAEKRFDGHVDGSGFLGLGSCLFAQAHFWIIFSCYTLEFIPCDLWFLM